MEMKNYPGFFVDAAGEVCNADGVIVPHPGSDFSQNGEQVHILHYFDVMGIDKGHLVDLGAGDGYTMSNSRALLNRGWTGDLYDGDPKGARDVQKVWITRAIIKEIAPSRCDFLNLDTDGNDYYLLAEFLKVSQPALIVSEINPIFPRDEAKVMPYNPEHVWDGTTYYGMSLAAAERLGKQYGYTLAYLHAGINAFLLRNDMAEKHPELVRPIEYRVKWDHRPHNPAKEWITLT